MFDIPSNEKIEKALFEVLEEGRVITADLGGSSSTKEFSNEIIKKLS